MSILKYAYSFCWWKEEKLLTDFEDTNSLKLLYIFCSCLVFFIVQLPLQSLYSVHYYFAPLMGSWYYWWSFTNNENNVLVKWVDVFHMFNVIHQSIILSISPLYSIHYSIIPSLVTQLSHPLIHYICIIHSLIHYNTCIISSSSPLYFIYQFINLSIIPHSKSI